MLHPLFQGLKYYYRGSLKFVSLDKGTTFSDFTLLVAKTCDLNKDTMSLQYRYQLPGQKREHAYVNIQNDEDLDGMFPVFEWAKGIVDVFVTGTPLDSKTNKNTGTDTHDDESQNKDSKRADIEKKKTSMVHSKILIQKQWKRLLLKHWPIDMKTSSAAAKHKASTQESKLDIKKDAGIKRKHGAAANDKASPQAMMFLGTLPSISNSIKKEVQDDPEGMKGRNHDAPSNTNAQVEEPSSVRTNVRLMFPLLVYFGGK